MRILVDATAFSDERSGAARRTIELFARVRRLAPAHDLVFRASPAFAEILRAALGDARIDPCPHTGGTPLARAFLRNRDLRRAALELDAAVIHQDTLPPAWPERTWPVIHDLRFLERDTGASLARRLFGRFRLPALLARCPRVIAPSAWVRDEIVRRLGVPRARAAVVRNGVDRAFFANPRAPATALARHALEPERYLLAVGHREPRKNLELLVRVIAALAPARPDMRLVIAGRALAGYRGPELEAERLGVAHRVRILEDVTTEELPALYRHAAVFLFPSVLEGFGIPVLEAMAAGAPVVAARTGPLPEVAGDRACADPHDAEAWIRELQALLDPAARRQVVTAQDAHVAAFDWTFAAQDLVDLYDSFERDRESRAGL
jgi:glycosyltransferase involved in cell wall biosynthesis